VNAGKGVAFEVISLSADNASSMDLPTLVDADLTSAWKGMES